MRDAQEVLVEDEKWMRRALGLARRGEIRASPNPLVGAVIVRDGRIIGEGWHRCCGQDHAEIEALKTARESVAGATVYVTLEPCCHHGKTPPCVERLLAARPGRVVAGTIDPNPLVAGKGMAALKRGGVATTVGVLARECERLNERFFTFMRTGLPFVTVKFAQSLDGRIATAAGSSRWISSEATLRFAHRLRAIHDGILVGAGTVHQDDPALTVRLVRGPNPLRIVLAGNRPFPAASRIFQTNAFTRTLLVVAGAEPAGGLLRPAGQEGLEVLSLAPDPEGRVPLPALLRALGKRNLTSLLVEGGSAVITAFLRQGLADRLVAVTAPKILGEGVPAVGDLGIRDVGDALALRDVRLFRRGPDWILDARLPKAPAEAEAPPGAASA